MRRRRKLLQVNTFPFLAVLLGAMGSLLLVLLIMDRQAKRAALARAMQTTAQAEAEEDRARTAQRAEEERGRQELHAELLRHDEELRGRLTDVSGRIAAAAVELRDEGEGQRLLEQQLLVGRTRLDRLESEMAAARTRGAGAAGQTDAARAEAAHLAADLAQLERLLAEIKAARRRSQRTYSVVPYQGKRGQGRRPVYVECAAAGVIFHPDGRALSVPGATRMDLRAEIERRVGDRGTAEEKDAYLLLLVRPDGVGSYYHALEAIKGLPVVFGYELIEADWVLDFPRGDNDPLPRAWTAAARAAASLSGPVVRSPAGGASSGPPRGVVLGGGPAARGESGPAAATAAGGAFRSPAAIECTPGTARAEPRGTSPGEGTASSAPPASAGRSPDPPPARFAAVESGPETGPTTTSAPSGAAPSSGAVAEKPEGPPAAPDRPGQSEPGGAAAPAGDRKPKPVRVGSSRDWTLLVECAAGAIILHPGRVRVATTARGADDQLWQIAEQMIARRQATVRPGEPPYRPQLRFLVRPDGLRTFHQAYPVLEALRLPMTRQDIDRDEEFRGP